MAERRRRRRRLFARRAPKKQTRAAQRPNTGTEPRRSKEAPRGTEAQRQRQAQIRQTQHTRRRKRKRNYTLHYILLGFFLTVAGITLSLTVFFNIKTISVAGSEVYTEEEVCKLIDAQVGDNLLRINTDRLSEELLEALTTAEEVVVKRRLPSTLHIEVTDGVPVIQFYQRGRYILLSQNGRVLSIQSSPEDQLITVLGFASELQTVGGYLDLKTDEEAADWLSILLTTLGEEDLNDITVVDLRDFIDVRLYYQNRFEIQLGSFSELQTKLQMVRTALRSDKVGLDEHGVIYASSIDQLIVDNAEINMPCKVGDFTWEEPYAIISSSSTDEEPTE